jgi:hypothetical protein
MSLKTELRDKVLDLRPFPVYMAQSFSRGIPGKPQNIPGDLTPPPRRNIFQGFWIDNFFRLHRASSISKHVTTIQGTSEIENELVNQKK